MNADNNQARSGKFIQSLLLDGVQGIAAFDRAAPKLG